MTRGFESDGDGAAIVPPGRVARGSVTAPPSKSHALRLLTIAALTPAATVQGLGEADDVVHVRDALHALRLDGGPARDVAVDVDVGGSGTGLRFVLAVAGLHGVPVRVTGDASLRARPVGTLPAALRALGVRVELDPGDNLPAVVTGPAVGARTVVVDAGASSQPLSALLLVGPALEGGLRICSGEIASLPYVDLTLAVMRRAGATVVVEARPGEVVYDVSGPYRGFECETVTGDWSSAAFLFGAAAATGGEVRIAGLQDDPVHADRRIVEVLRSFGAHVSIENDAVTVSGSAHRPVDVDLRNAPDIAPLVGALGCLADGPTRVRGAPHLRGKETDRIAAVVAAARGLGFEADEHADGFTVVGGSRAAGTGVVDPRGDHRIAMAFAAGGAGLGGVRITDPACVAKSFPGFWDALHSLLLP